MEKQALRDPRILRKNVPGHRRFTLEEGQARIEIVWGVNWTSKFENYFMFQDYGPDGEYSEAHLSAKSIPSEK